MNLPALARFRRRLANDEPVFGLWATFEAPAVTEIAVGLGCDWVVIDAEHGQLDWADIAGHLRATARSHTVALVRLAELNAGLIKRALDLGADGVVIPMVDTVEQLKQALTFALYPPEGRRGIGAERATGWGQCLVEHTAAANDNVLVVPILETVQALANIDALAKAGGVEVFYFGPADYSASSGYRGQWEGPGVAEQILAMKETLRRAGKHCGLVATGEDDLRRRREQGFRMIGLGLDSGLLIRSLRGMLQAAGREPRFNLNETGP